MNSKGLHWKPILDSKVWIFTIESEECKDPNFKCYSPDKTELKFIKDIVYRSFCDQKQFYDVLKEFAEYSDAITGFRDDIDSLVLQISAHGEDFHTMSFGKTNQQVDKLLMKGQLRPNRNTVVLLNECWAGWPTWPRLISTVRNNSPRFVFGSRKRFMTSTAALNKAEKIIVNWLGGVESAGSSCVDLTNRINSEVGSSIPSHGNFYRVWHWSNGSQVSYPRAIGGQSGVPELVDYWLVFEDVVVHLLVPKEEADCVEDGKSKLIEFGNIYSVVKHKPHTSKNQYHIHVFIKGNEIFALNIDGTTHDHKHGIIIPVKVADVLKKMFPKFTFPKDNFVKMAYCLE
jgi:hypothetical protein